MALIRTKAKVKTTLGPTLFEMVPFTKFVFQYQYKVAMTFVSKDITKVERFCSKQLFLEQKSQSRSQCHSAKYKVYISYGSKVMEKINVFGHRVTDRPAKI